MSAVQAVNIGYSPKHAAKPPAPRSVSKLRRLRSMVLVVFAFALLAAGTGVVVLRTDRAAMSCRAVTACTSRVFGIDTGASLRVVIADRTVFGWRSPTAIGFCNGKFWVTDPAANSVAEFDWKSDGMPVIGPDDHYRFARPHVLTGRRGRLWIATANSITEMNAIDGKVIRVVARAATRNVTALVLFGRRLWVANTRNLAEINATTGTLLGVFRSHRYGFDRPTALAVSRWTPRPVDGLPPCRATLWVAGIRSR